jgi:hypothetical protein
MDCCDIVNQPSVRYEARLSANGAISVQCALTESGSAQMITVVPVVESLEDPVSANSQVSGLHIHRE